MNPSKNCPKLLKSRNAPSEPTKLHSVRYGGAVVWRLEKYSLPDENEVYKDLRSRFFGAWKLGILLTSRIVDIGTKASKERPTIQAGAVI